MTRKILIVDDDRDFVSSLQYRLETRGYEVETCAHGGEAHDKIVESDFGLVLLDYFLPGVKGDEICESLRQDANRKHIPIIIITGFSDYKESFFKDKGATDVLYKPFEMDELFERIERYMPQ